MTKGPGLWTRVVKLVHNPPILMHIKFVDKIVNHLYIKLTFWAHINICHEHDKDLCIYSVVLMIGETEGSFSMKH